MRRHRYGISLQEYCIENHMEYLLDEWDYEKNGSLTPKNVTAGSIKKVWWLQPYDDNDTGKHFDFSWQASIASRVYGRGCPYLFGKAVWIGFNDLTSTHPELAAEWDYEKNGDLTPENVTAKSNKKAWWKCSICGHGWKAIISNRRITGCPECTKEMNTSFPEQAVSFYLEKHFPDAENGNRTVLDGKELDVYIPSIPAAVEYDGAWFHKNVKRDLEKNQLCAEKGVLLIRIREDGCLAMEDALFLKVISCIPKKEDSLADAICQTERILGISNMDVDIDRDRQEIYSRYIKRRKENSLAATHPELAAQWHPVKNGTLTPENVTAGSQKKVWWLQPYDDPKTGKHFDFEWQASVVNWVKGTGCPYLFNQAVWKGFNDLATTHPELAVQWHPTRNGNLTPEDVTAGNDKKIWWQFPYDDLKTGRHFDFEWQASITNRVKGNECPYLSGMAVWRGFNDLGTTHPELAAQWHPTRNGNLTPKDVTAGSGRKVWWILSYDDKKTGRHFDFSWEARINDRAGGHKCPYLTGNKVWKGFNDLETYCKENGRLDILSQWDYEKNGDLKPSDVMAGSGKRVWWIKDGKSRLKVIQSVVNF